MQTSFNAQVLLKNNNYIIKVPKEISELLDSRGMNMADIAYKNMLFSVPLEPDGNGSHWFYLSELLIKNEKLSKGDIINITMEPSREWLEPVVPDDLMDKILSENLFEKWNSLTVKARWEWIRFIRSTKNESTRSKRISVLSDKLLKGDKRPCCFDTTRCTITEVSKNGILEI